MKRDFAKEDVYTLMAGLRELILSDPRKALKTIEDLETVQRFKTDQAFYCVVMIEKISAFTFLGMHDEIGLIIQNVYNKVLELNDTKILLEACSRLGIAYSEIGNVEQSILLLNEIHKIEKSIGKISMLSSIAYNNLASVYLDFDKIDDAKFCFERGYELFQDHPDLFDYPEAYIFYPFILSNLSVIAGKKNNMEDFLFYSEKMKSIPEEKRNHHLSYLYTQLDLTYNKLIKNYKDGAYKLLDIIEELIEIGDIPRISYFLVDFYDLAKKAEFDEEFIIQKVIHYLDPLHENGLELCLRTLYLHIIDYAVERDLNALMVEYYQRLSVLMKKSEEQNDRNKSQSLNLFVEVAEKKKDKEKIVEMNRDLYRLTEENKQKSVKIKRLYDQSRIITRLGQKITATSTLSSIEKTIYYEFSSLIPFEFMALYTKASNGEYIAPLVFDRKKVLYKKKIHTQEKELDFEKKMLEGNLDYIGNIDTEVFDSGRDHDSNSTFYKSYLYYPIKYKTDFVAILLLKSSEREVYKHHHLDLIEAVSPYISIAIVNWFRSDVLSEKNKNLEKDKKKLEEMVAYHRVLSNMDQLTKIPNRRYFEHRFKTLVKMALEEKLMLHLIIFDIDNFKIYNDKNGHIKGDEALVKVVQTVQSMVQSENTVFARFGGEEFIIVHVGDDRETLVDFCENMCKNVENLGIKYNDGTGKNLSVSVGLVSLNYRGILSPSSLIKYADEVLYQAKNTGKNKVVSKLIQEEKEEKRTMHKRGYRDRYE